MSKKWLLPAALTVGVFLALVGYGDFGDTVTEIGSLPLRYLFAGLGLASANYLLRFLRWAFYLKVLKIDAPAGVSTLVFLSGLAMSVTPGKAGELVKCYLLNSRTGVPVTRSAPCQSHRACQRNSSLHERQQLRSGQEAKYHRLKRQP